MKTLVILLLLLLPILAIAQDPMYSDTKDTGSSNAVNANEPFKGAHTIIIDTGLDSDEAFKMWGRHLAQNGYSIANSNNDFLTISTGPKDTSRFNYAYVLNSSVGNDGKIITTIKWQLKSSFLASTRETNYYDWEYKAGKNNVTNIIHNDVMSVINDFGSYPISYK